MFRTFSNTLNSLLAIQNAVEAARDEDFFGIKTTGRAYGPLINIFEEETGLVLYAEIPGLKKEDLKIEVKDNRIQISGKRKVSFPEKASIHRVERKNTDFSRALKLPIRVDKEQVEASYEDGVLKITLPRAESDKPRKIAVA